ncbi:MAG: BON domain-containing protein [Planctomycetaceae bacterium]|nr:BON domain-containing protein [Planctomycetaceae bacterium]
MGMTETVTGTIIEDQSPQSIVCQNVLDSLKQTGLKPLQHIQVIEEENQLILKGWVPSFHLKQVAQTLVMNTRGVRNVKNELEVF